MAQTSTTLTREDISTKHRQMPSARSLVIIDSSVDDLELLKTGLKPGTEVVVLHPQFNGIEQITALVSRRQNLQKVHLVSHGSSGSLKLGASELNSDNIDKYSSQLQTWFTNFSDSISLYVYSCQVADGVAGQNFVQKFHNLTGANIAAATRVVGSARKGGVWQLDYTLGVIDSEMAFANEVIQNYSGTFMDEEPLTNFEGAEIQVQTFVPDRETAASDPISEVVGDGAEFTFSDDIEPSDQPSDNFFIVDNSIDFTENSIIYRIGEDTTPFTAPGEFNGYVFSDASGELPPIVNVTIDESVTTYGLELDDITFTEDTIEINEAGIDVEPGLITKLDVEFGEPETELETEPETETSVAEEPIEEPGTKSEPVTETIVEEEPVAEVPVTMTNDTIDLSNVAEGDTVLAMFSVDREAGFDNTVDFYEVNADGSVVDLDSGETIAVEQEGYTEAALANRLGLDLATENGVSSEFSTELEGGKIYAPFIAVDSSIEALTDDNSHNDSTIYFTYAEANPDGFDHVRSSESNAFEFEDLPNGGDMDFNDVVVSVSLDNTEIPETSAEKPVAEEPVMEAPVEEPVEEVSVEEPVAEEPIEELEVEEPVEELVNDEATVDEVADEPVEEAVEESSEDSVVSDNFEGAEIELQIFGPTLDDPAGEPLTATVSEGFEFEQNTVESSDIPGNQIFIVDVDIDISGGGAGEGSIFFEVNEDEETGNFLSGDFNGYVFTDTSDNLAPIENVTLNDGVTTLEGLDSSAISFDENTIRLDVGNLRYEPGRTWQLDVEFADV